MLTIAKRTENGKAVLAPEGRVDTTTAPELERVIKEIVPSSDSLTLDFQKVDYISSAGLRVLLSAHKALCGKGGMKIVNVSDSIKEIFEITGFYDILNIG